MVGEQTIGILNMGRLNGIYISGPMTGLPDNNFLAFNAAAEFLRRTRRPIENPAEKGQKRGWKWVDYLRYDIRKLMDCSTIAMLPGWTKSRGACLEYLVAGALDFDVWYMFRAETFPPKWIVAAMLFFKLGGQKNAVCTEKRQASARSGR